jgi:isoamylase
MIPPFRLCQLFANANLLNPGATNSGMMLRITPRHAPRSWQVLRRTADSSIVFFCDTPFLTLYQKILKHQERTNYNLSEKCGAEGEITNAGIRVVAETPDQEFSADSVNLARSADASWGDEFRHTQGGNNAFCQDKETSWHDWSFLERHGEIFRFTRGMIAFRYVRPILSKEQFYADKEIHWFGQQGGLPNWGEPKEKRFACMIHEDQQRALFSMCNAGTDAVDSALRAAPAGARWHLAVDTSQEAPRDLFATGEEPFWEDLQNYHLSPRSSAILLSVGTGSQE